MDSHFPAKEAGRMKITSLSGLMTIFVGLGIIFIGIREFLYPMIASRGFGVPLQDIRDKDFLAIKAARDLASGIVTLLALALRNRKFLAYVMGAFALIPVFDGLIVLRHAGWTFTPIILIHWGTAALMLVVVSLLRKGK
jgi:hypothetical protein